MPRRRMIDPFFYTDPKVGKISRDERSLIVGCVCQADDEGRLQGDPAFLKSQIFKYDKDLDDTAIQELRDNCLTKMQPWPANHPYRMILYSSSDEEYIFFPNWNATNRPSHPSKSQLPPPPLENLPRISGDSPEDNTKPSALGQSSLVKVSIGQGSSGKVREDFTNLLDNEKDLTDRLTMTLTEYMPRGRQHSMEIVKKLWEQAGKTMDAGVWEVIYEALGKYPVPVLARSLVKAVNYSSGKKKPANYIKAILEEKLENNK